MTSTPTTPAPIKEGLAAHLRRIDGLINDLNQEISALQRIEKALRDCHERLDRQGGLIVMETQLVSALIQRDAKPPTPTATSLKTTPITNIADRVEEDLKNLVSLTSEPPEPVPSVPIPTTSLPIPLPRR